MPNVTTPLPLLPSDAPVGVFDSGVGGLSVLRHIQAQLPQENLLYFADTGFAPYGDRSVAFIEERSLLIAEFLLQRGAKALVVACNTATTAAIKRIRADYPLLPIVGVEPGLKPAVALTRSGTIGVLATARTVAGEKFQLLQAQLAASSNATVLPQACVGLVECIESGDLDGPDTAALLERYILPLLDQGADTLVMGCTHYPFVMPAIAALVARAGKAPVALVDTGEAVARQLGRLLLAAGLLRGDGAPPVLRGYSSASKIKLASAFASLLNLAPPVEEALFPASLAA